MFGSILDKLSKKVKQGFLNYALGLVLNKEKSTCSKMASFLGISHDFLYRFLSYSNLLIPVFPKLMVALAHHFNKVKKGWIIIDDTTMSKPFAKAITGIYEIYNTALKRTDRGFCLVVIAWSNGNVTIPLGFRWYFNKDIVGKDFKTKSELAWELLLEFKDLTPFTKLVVDAHYTTLFLLEKLVDFKIPFLGKIAKNRTIIRGNQKQKIEAMIRLNRNRRSKKTLASYGGMRFYFSAHKEKKRNGDYAFKYLVSNIDMEEKEYLAHYKNRWQIEVMFRTSKQSLGLTHCASRDLQKQELHIYTVFFSYGFLQNEKNKHSFEKTEDAIKLLSELKTDVAMSRITAFSGNFDHVA